MKKNLVLLCFFLACAVVYAQETFPTNGVRDDKPELYALTNATIVVKPGLVIEKGTLVVRKGVIEAAGASVAVPKGAVVYDMNGKWIYPSFIDPDSDYGMPEVKASGRPSEDDEDEDGGPQLDSKKKGAYGWNQALNPEVNAFALFTANKERAEELRKSGFGAVLTHKHDGIARGTSAFVLLGDERENATILRDKVAAHYSFDKGTSTQDYPGSLMGAIALLRQTYLDAAWYKRSADRREYNLTLEAWNATQNLPQIFDAEDKLSVLRADKVGDEFGVQYIIRGSGDEYQRLPEIKAAGAKLIIPVNFPLPYDVEDPFDALNVSLAQMKHWELAPSNPALLAQAGIPFAFTCAKLKKKEDFLSNIRTAIQRGLSKDKALEALTLQPAMMLGLGDKIGSLEKGRTANFLVTSGDVFDKNTILYENWVDGSRYTITYSAMADLRGTYDLALGIPERYTLLIDGTPSEVKTRVAHGRDTIPAFVTRVDRSVTLRFSADTSADADDFRLSGWINGPEWTGRGQRPNGSWMSWTARLITPYVDKTEKDTTNEPVVTGILTYPNVEYGWERLPTAEKTLIKNATVWTCEAEGKQENTDVLIDNGKIASIGKGLSAAGAVVIDATGKHVTPGIIDEHSHIAISRGVNEWTQAVTSEVRIGDVLNSDDVNIYRQLAGGVTTSQLLHGSANPIGGQAQLIKLRWGHAPEELKFEGADPFIKFALGENVKQSNWGDKNVIRFPQSRMGVEQVFMDAFTRAREYEQSTKRGEAPRRDLKLDALVEILNSKRFITCHSYVQSEITMLMRVAEQFGFRVNTFTHILEGYKVADKMQKHGAGGSTFSDWWAYKYEVIDAIPYNGAIMHRAGIVTAFNSDDAEMARRLNQEAAKAVKYGNVSEEEALQFVTINPAKLLHIDGRTGSLKTGKDADVVVWSDNPLSVYAHVEQTFVDGIRYFDITLDRRNREAIERERERLTKKMIDAKSKGGKTQKPVRKKEHNYHCEDIGEEHSGE